ncbi:MAG TPA: hypothetical protein VMF60_01460 [Acidimicrobiales bacterium]|nr:hypothetical protein [Acidimicrobiales bacterium]
MWELVTAWLEFPGLYELQRTKAAADRRAIGEAIAPYLAPRDRKSVQTSVKEVL